MKKIFTLGGSTLLVGLSALLFAFTSHAQMSGTYTVGGASPDFTTIQDACDSLVSQGISGPVTINIRDGVYNQPVVLNAVSGVSPSNTVTFQSESMDNTLVTLSSSATTFNCRTDHVIFNHLSFDATSVSSAFVLTSASELTVNSCAFSAPSSYALWGTNYSTPGSSSINNVSITNSTFSGGQGIYFESEWLSGFNISQSVINVSNTGIEFYADNDVQNLLIDQCNVTSTNFMAISLEAYLGILGNVELNQSNITGQSSCVRLNSDNLIDGVILDSLYCFGQTTSNTTGFTISGDGSIHDVNMSYVTMDTMWIAINLNAKHSATDFHINNSHFEGDFYGILAQTDYGILGNFSMSDTYLSGGTAPGLYMRSDFLIEDVQCTKDSVLSVTGHAIDIGSNSGNGIKDIYLDSVYALADTTTSNRYALSLTTNNTSIKNVTLNNSDFWGGQGMYFSAGLEAHDVAIDNSNFYGMSSGCCGRGAEVNAFLLLKNIYLNDVYAYSNGWAGFGFEGYSGAVENMWIENSTFEGEREGLVIDTETGTEELNLIGNTCTGVSSYGLYIDHQGGPVSNVTIDSCSMIGENRGINFAVGGNSPTSRVRIENNYLSSHPSANGYGMLFYTDGTVDDLQIAKNTVEVPATNSGFGFYIGGYSGIKNTIVENNQLKVGGPSGFGMYIENVDSMLQVSNNIVDTMGTASLQYGVYVSGEYHLTRDVYVEGNTIYNARYGFVAEYSITDLYIRNNVYRNLEANQNDYGIYVWNAIGGDFEITGNQFLTAGEQSGIYLEQVHLDSLNKGLIANNFVTNFYEGCYFADVENMVVANNSFTTPFNATHFELTSTSSGVEFYNNIVQVDSTNFTAFLYRYDEPGSITGMDNNIYNISPTNASLIRDDWFGNAYNTLADWNGFSGMEGNSFIYEPMFVNDTLDLHIDCSDATLISGMAISVVIDDIDGTARANIPTIGADEILSSNNVVVQDTAWICADPIMLDAGSTPGATYLWSTTETSSTILVSAPGTYTVDVTDACGTYSDAIEILQVTNTTAAASHQVSFLTVLFNNGSSNASSYFWDFGDGNTGTDMNPSHTYAAPQTYTVTLIAYGECNNDTMQFTVDPTTVGIEEVPGFEMNLYPNPTTSELNIALGMKDYDQGNLSLMDLSGRVLESRQVIGNGSQVIRIDLSAYANGVYLIQLQIGDSRLSRRVIKQ